MFHPTSSDKISTKCLDGKTFTSNEDKNHLDQFFEKQRKTLGAWNPATSRKIAKEALPSWKFHRSFGYKWSPSNYPIQAMIFQSSTGPTDIFLKAERRAAAGDVLFVKKLESDFC
ncbi:hypothetical protein TNCV_2949461 [Trichonephila clavipes]|nr:hypothetical protein TNCV_2949461 [Trichonephila clavipes]